jgi:2-iminoacetate synthase ThiH
MRLSDSSFLPRLEKLAVKGYEEDWEEDWVYEADPLHDVTKLTQEMFDRVVHGLALRRRPVDAAHLKSFSLESSSSLLKPIQPQVVEQLQALSAEGLDLYIQTGDQNWI